MTTPQLQSDALDVALLRELNRRTRCLADFAGPRDYACECGHPTCNRTMVEVDHNEIEQILAEPECALVAPGHDRPGTEVVRYGDGYLIVRRTADGRPALTGRDLTERPGRRTPPPAPIPDHHDHPSQGRSSAFRATVASTVPCRTGHATQSC
jgi:hypothetical protein